MSDKICTVSFELHPLLAVQIEAGRADLIAAGSHREQGQRADRRREGGAHLEALIT
jgi:hypothetical protein